MLTGGLFNNYLYNLLLTRLGEEELNSQFFPDSSAYASFKSFKKCTIFNLKQSSDHGLIVKA